MALLATATIVYSSASWFEVLAPGGFVESAIDTALRAKPTATDIAGFLPSDRGAFSFPIPYNTQGYRLTTASDCAGADCVAPIGATSWSILNNSAGSDTLYAVVALAGNGGPTLFSLNKTTGAVTNVGALFASGPHAADSGENYYFSGTAATTLYVPEAQALLRYDIIAHTPSIVFDITTQAAKDVLGTDPRRAEGYSSSHDDLVHAFSVGIVDGGLIGCAVYHEATAQYAFIGGNSEYSGCLIDKSGGYVVLAEGSQLRSVDLQSEAQYVFTGARTFERGLDTGYGYILVENARDRDDPALIQRWFLDRPATAPGQGTYLAYMPAGADTFLQPTHGNATPAPAASQYACQSAIRAPGFAAVPRDGDLVCYPLDGSGRVLVVAPSLTDLGGLGGLSLEARVPRPSIDPTGEFMVWTSNTLGSGRLDAFIVRIPGWRLGTTPVPDTTPPTVSLTAPINTASVTETVNIQATAADDAELLGVQIRLDGINFGPQLVAAPFTASWNTTTVPDGVHTITAVASDRYGNHTTSDPVLVTVLNTPAPPQISNVGVLQHSDTSVIVLWTTNHLTNSQVQYGTTTPYNHMTPMDAALVARHSQLLTDLEPATTYHFQVTSTNSLGLSASSADLTFVTLGGNNPELPRTFLDTTFQEPAGTRITVNADDSLQAAIDAAQPGDVIVLEAGATFNGNFVLRNKPGDGWIYIVSSALASLPGPGSRVRPSDSQWMPKLVTPNFDPVLSTTAGAHHYRFVGIEFATTWASTDRTFFHIIDLGAPNPASSVDAPHHLTFDRCYVHGTPTGNIRRAIAMNSASTAIIDSHIDDIHEISADSQAIASWNGAGPFKIVNNFLSAAGENLMFGGADPSVPFLVPSDLEIRGNYFWKPLTWKADDSSFAGIDWTVKNLLELKNAQRALVEGNVLENSWAGAQTGFAAVFTTRNQDGEAPWSVVQDIAFRRNVVRHAGGGVNLSGSDNNFPSLRATRILVRDNLFDDITAAWGRGWGFGINISAPENTPVVGVNHLTIEHNTVLSDAAYAFTDSGAIPAKAQDNFTFRNNVVMQGAFGFRGSGTGDGQPTLDAYYIAPVFTANGIIGGVQDRFETFPGNQFPLDTGAVFVDAAGGNYALLAASTLVKAGTDGLDIGANIALVSAATATAVLGANSASATVISNTGATAITGTTATITWTTDLPADSRVEYGATALYGSITETDTTLVTSHSVTLTVLTPGTTYHFRVHSTTGAGWMTTSSDAAFSTIAAPALSALTASNITGSSATISWTTDQAATSQVDYGITTEYGNSTTLESSLVTTHSQSLSGLLPGTTYHYRVSSRNAVDLSATSGDATFTTAAPPVLSSVMASAITETSASIAWLTDQMSSSQVEYGLTSAYGNETPLDGSLVGSHSQSLAGLSPGTLYHYRAISTTSLGLKTASNDFTLTTLVPAPVISNVAVLGITSTSATIGWTTDSASSSQIEYGLTTAYGNTATVDPNAVLTHSLPLAGLTSDATYHFRVISTTTGGTTTSGDFTLTTGVPPPAISGVLVSGATTTSASIGWTTDWPANSQVEYGPTTAYGNSTSLDLPLVTAHSQLLSGLAGGTMHHFRVKSSTSGGITTSSDFTFATLDPAPVLSNIASSGITTTGAIITWTTDRASDSEVEYGPTTAYGSTTTRDANVVFTHSQPLAGLLSGTLYHYRVVSTTNGGATTSSDFTLTTLDPAPVLSNITSTAITTTGATIAWTTDRASDSEVEYGPTTGYGGVTTIDLPLATTHSQSLSGLSTGTTYHFRVKSRTNGGLTTSEDFTFTTLVPAPVLSNILASGVTTTSATIGWTTDSASSSQVEYGLTTAYGTTTTVDPNSVLTHSQLLSGLAGGTMYHVRVTSSTNGGMTTSGDFTFTTLDPAPVLSNITSTAITTTGATIAWTTDRAADSQVEYGTTTAYGSTTPLDASAVFTHSQPLAGLSTGTTYHFRVKSRTNGGLTTSDDVTLTTLVPPPVLSNILASGVTTTSATIGWTTDSASSSQVEYGLTTAYGTTTTVDPNAVLTHGQLLSGLAGGTMYHVRVTSSTNGGMTTSGDFTFATLDPAPVLSNIMSTAITTTGATITWTTDRAADSQVEYGTTTAYGSTTTLDANTVLTHSQQLSGLAGGTIYHVRVTSGTNGGMTTSGDFTFTTLDPAPVLSNIASTAITTTGATITWTTDRAADSQVEYGTTTAYGSTTPLDASAVFTHSQPLAGLSTGTTYHFRVKSRTNGGLTTSDDVTLTTLVPAPVLSNILASGVTTTSATIGWTTDSASSSQVEYGLTTAYGNTTTVDPNAVLTHSQLLAGLTPDATYHFRVISTTTGGTTTSGDFTLTTLNPAPAISSVLASSITASSASIAWTTDRAATSQIEYGTTTAYGNSTSPVLALVTAHSQQLSGLAGGTMYHVRVTSSTNGGMTTSGDFTFTTLDPAPVLFNIASSGITTTGATITWTTDRASDSQVEYGPTTTYGFTMVDPELVTSHRQTLNGLNHSTTYHYRVKSTNAGGSTYSDDFTFTTLAPPPVISNVAASDITSTSATIGWASDPASNSQVEYGLTTGYGSTTVLNTTAATLHSQGLTELAPATTYHYRVKSGTNGGLTTSGDFTFTTLVPAPVISNVAASGITSTSATIGWGSDPASNSQVEYGLTTGYGSTTVFDATAATLHSQGLTELAPATTYHYRVKSGTNGGLTTSGDFTFTTLVPAPVLSNILASGVTTTSATIGWTTDSASSSQVEYGLTTAYGNRTTVDPNAVLAHSLPLASLTSDATYHFRVISTTTGGTTTSDDFTFTTLDPAPVLANITSTAISTTGATITWTTDRASDSQVEYGPTTGYGGVTTIDLAPVTTHSQSLSGLSTGTTYHFRVKSRTNGGLTTSDDVTFTTLVPAPVLSNILASGVTTTSATIGWTTDSASSSQVEYGLTTAYGNTTTVDPNAVLTHSQLLAGLTPDATYHFRVISTTTGGTTTSDDFTFTTLDPAPVLSNITSTAISTTGATITWTSDRAADSQIEYGTTTAYGITTTIDPGLVTTHSQSLSGLSTGTTYHVRARSRTNGGLTTSDDVTFTTLVPAPVLSNIMASGITTTSASIGWTTDWPADSQVEYGPTTVYGSTTTIDPALVTTHSQSLSGLSTGTTYHVRVKSRTNGGLTTSEDFTFTTLVPAPVLSNILASGVTTTSATIGWGSDPASNSQVEYGLTTGYGSATVLDPTTAPLHSQGLTELAPATTYHYRVKSATNGGLTTSGDFTFTTLVPAPVPSNILASGMTTTSATIGWTTDWPADSQVEYGTTTAYGNTTTLDTNAVLTHSQPLSGLSTGTPYHFRVKSRTNGGLATSEDFTFTTLVPAPVPSNILASGVTTTLASIGWTTDWPADSQVEYGPTTAYGSTTTIDPALVTTHSQSLSGLSTGTPYHVRVKSRTNGGLTTSEDFTFTTLVPAPVLSNILASGLTTTSATIGWTTDWPADSQVEYGTTTTYGNTTTLDANVVFTHSQSLSGLSTGTAYHFRVKSRTNGGLTTSEDFTFTTLVPAPVLSNILASGLTTTSATIGWTTDRPADSQVEYGTTAAYGSTTSLDTNAVVTHSQPLAGLLSDTLYHYRVISTTNGGATTSGDFTFTTPNAVPVISGIGVTAVTGTSATIGWTTDQSTTSQVDYGLTSDYGTVTTLDSTSTTTHAQNLSGLAIGTTYHYRVKSTNEAGLTTMSPDATFSTVPAPVMTSIAVTALTGTTAAIGWTTDQTSTSRVEYGVTTAYGATTTIDSSLVTAHVQALSALSAGTTYHYRVQSANVHGTVATSDDGSFTTVAPPVLTGIAAADVTPISVNIVWASNQPSDSQVEYGPTTAYGSTTVLVPTLTTSHAVALAGLVNSTTYHYRVRSANAVGLVTFSGDATFITVAPAVISGLAATAVDPSSASIVWATNQPADSTIEYGLTPAYGNTPLPDPTLVTSHAVAFSGLTASTTYHYRVVSRNVFGLPSTSSDGTFMTAAAHEDSGVTLTILKNGTGTGTVSGPEGIDCGTACSADIAPGVPITLTAIASTGSTFVGWSGACSGTQPACTVSATTAAAVTASFTSATPGDFDGDGYADLVWQHEDGTLALWRMQGTTLLSSTFITTRDRSPIANGSGPVLTQDSRVVDPNWRIVATPDLDGNGKADLLWQNIVTGELTAWIMEGAVRIRVEALSPASVDPVWRLQTAADFNGDGRPDLLWHHDGTNQLDVWFMNGTTRVAELTPQPTTVSAEWRLVGSADFDRDGQLDLVWQNQTNGDTFLWCMNGTTLRTEEAIGRFGDGWQARAVADFDLDGHPDIIWQKNTGELAAWFMNGHTVIRTAALDPGVVHPAWRIVGAR